jgi:hypothetical protein
MRRQDLAGYRQSESHAPALGRVKRIKQVSDPVRLNALALSLTATQTSPASLIVEAIDRVRARPLISANASMALCTRFSTTCCSFTRSPLTGGTAGSRLMESAIQ